MAALLIFTAMKICIVYNAHPTGCSYYRLEMPNAYLGDNYPEFDYVCVENITNISDEGLRSIDLFLFSRLWCQGTMEQVENVYKALTQFGAKVILDLDDYWVLESGHIMYRHYHETKLAEVIRKHIKLADWVTCTTEHLASRIRPLNANVSILQNEPYEAYQQFIPNPDEEPDKHLVKFGWFGGAQHGEDMELLREGMQKLRWDANLDGKYRLYLGGWNDNNPVYEGYEKIISDQGNNPNYGRIQAADIYSYVGGYNFVNVTLAPLRDTKFNKLKSELKVVEAGWMNKAIIASETIPYTDVIRHGENGFLVPYNKPKDWYKYIKQLILDHDLRKGLADNLTRDIKKQFNVAETAKKRAELYRRIGRKL